LAVNCPGLRPRQWGPNDEQLMMWFLIPSYALVSWLIGYDMGYRRGVRDAINDDIAEADQLVNGD
jgi:hypothetical protein